MIKIRFKMKILFRTSAFSTVYVELFRGKSYLTECCHLTTTTTLQRHVLHFYPELFVTKRSNIVTENFLFLFSQKKNS